MSCSEAPPASPEKWDHRRGSIYRWDDVDFQKTRVCQRRLHNAADVLKGFFRSCYAWRDMGQCRVYQAELADLKLRHREELDCIETMKRTSMLEAQLEVLEEADKERQRQRELDEKYTQSLLRSNNDIIEHLEGQVKEEQQEKRRLKDQIRELEAINDSTFHDNETKVASNDESLHRLQSLSRSSNHWKQQRDELQNDLEQCQAEFKQAEEEGKATVQAKIKYRRRIKKIMYVVNTRLPDGSPGKEELLDELRQIQTLALFHSRSTVPTRNKSESVPVAHLLVPKGTIPLRSKSFLPSSRMPPIRRRFAADTRRLIFRTPSRSRSMDSV